MNYFILNGKESDHQVARELDGDVEERGFTKGLTREL